MDIDDLGNLKDLPRLVFIDQECGNNKVFNNCRKFTRNIKKKRKPDVLQAYRCSLCDK